MLVLRPRPCPNLTTNPWPSPEVLENPPAPNHHLLKAPSRSNARKLQSPTKLHPGHRSPALGPTRLFLRSHPQQQKADLRHIKQRKAHREHSPDATNSATLNPRSHNDEPCEKKKKTGNPLTPSPNQLPFRGGRDS